MPIISLTGSQEERTTEIQRFWLVFEPSSLDKMLQCPLYTVPIGQSFAATMNLVSGSVTMNASGAIEITKLIHIFEDNSQAADSFLSDVGVENISSYSDRRQYRADGTSSRIQEIQTISEPKLKFEMDLVDAALARGFKIEVFTSSSNGLVEIDNKAVFNAKDELISDTYLKYFEIEVDVND